MKSSSSLTAQMLLSVTIHLPDISKEKFLAMEIVKKMALAKVKQVLLEKAHVLTMEDLDKGAIINETDMREHRN